MIYFYLIKKINILLYIFFFLIHFNQIVLASELDTKSWNTLNYKVLDMALYDQDNIITINQKNEIRLINIHTKKINRFPGSFKRIYKDNGNLYALSFKNNLFQLKKRIWKKLNINNNFSKNNFTIFNNYIYFIDKGQVKIVDIKGKKAKNTYINKLKDVKQIILINDEKFLILNSNNEFLLYDKNQIIIKRKNIKKILQADKDFFSILEKNGAVIFFSTDKPKNTYRKIKFKFNDLNNISVLDDGVIWASDKRKIYISSYSINDFLLSIKDKNNLKVNKFFSSDQTATKLFSGNDGIFKIDEYGYLNIWDFQKEVFNTLNIKPAYFSNPKKNTFWAINSLGRVFYYNSKKWKQIKGLAKDISSNKNLTIKINEKNKLEKFDLKKKKFTKTGIKADKIMVVNDREFWIIYNTKTSKCLFNGYKLSKSSVKCNTLSKSLKNIKISRDNKIYALNNKNFLEYYDGNKFQKVKNNLGSMSDFELFQNGLIWALDENNRIYKNKKKYNTLLKTSSFHLKKTFEEKDILGTGDVILYGKKAGKKEFESSASISSGGFKFKRNMKRKSINNRETFIDLNFGRDGRLWAVSDSYNVFQYQDKSKLFKLYNKTNFLSGSQKFLGLPTSIPISRISSDDEGKIWAVKNNSKEVYYQLSVKGRFNKAKIDKKASNITDLTIDKSGNIFIAAREIFKWNSKNNKFELYIKKYSPFDRISSGITGTLLAVNDNGLIYELIGGNMKQKLRNKSFKANNIDISSNGEVYVTSETQKRTITTVVKDPFNKGKTITLTETLIDKCDLFKLDAFKNKVERVFTDRNIYADIIAVSNDGTPWFSSGGCGNTNVYHGTN